MRPDMNGAFDEFDNMVEALEEQEDMVECKECFDLFHKADCIKQEHGYLCPTCNRAFEPKPEFDSRTLTTDLYDQEFPEVVEYSPGTVKDWTTEATVEDALETLLKDEYDAVDGYEVADEIIQHSDASEEEKDEILDTLDHIKDEEEEHIDELKELATDAEDEDADADLDEDDIEESLEESAGDLYTAEDLETGEIIAACYAASEDEAISILTQEFTERTGKLGSELEDCYITKAENEEDIDGGLLVEAFNDKETLTEGPRRFLKNLGQKAGNLAKHIANKDSGKIIDQFFNEGYIIWFTPKDRVKEKPPVWKQDGRTAGHKETFSTIDEAITAARNYSDHYRNFIVKVLARPIDTTDLSPKAKKIADVDGDFGALIASYSNKVASVNNAAKIADSISELLIDEKDLLKTTGHSIGTSNKNGKPDPKEEEPDEETESEDEDLEDEEEDENLEDEENPLEDLRKKALELLGEKRDPAAYTEESYTKYSPLYDKALKAIQGAKKPETFEKTYIPALPGLVKKWDDTVLVKKKADPTPEDPEDVEDIPEDEDDLDAVKKAAHEALGEKLASDGYTSESYEAYSKKFDAAVRFIENQTDVETLKKYDFAKLKAKYEALLEKETEDIPEDPGKPDPETPEEEETDTEEENEEESEDESDEESEDENAPKGKLSALSDVQLAKLFSAASGKAVGYADAEQTKLSDKWHKEMNKIRRKLQSLGEGLSTEDKLIETLKQVIKESEDSYDDEDEVECTWCHDIFPKSECRYEVDLEWLCSRCEMAIKSRGETLTFREGSYWDFLDEDLSTETEAKAQLKDTAASLKSTAASLQNMTSAMKESILNLSPEDFAECVDSSRVELWGLEEPEDGVAHAVLIKTYDDVPSEDVQACHDKMLELDGMFTFCFTASGKPSLWGWNAEQLRELNRAGFKGISFDNPAYEEALSLAWRLG